MKAKDIEIQKIKTQEDENLVLRKEFVENADLYKPALKKDDDHMRIIRKIQFRSSFKCTKTNLFQ